jgi:hypothetical protein
LNQILLKKKSKKKKFPKKKNFKKKNFQKINKFEKLFKLFLRRYNGMTQTHSSPGIASSSNNSGSGSNTATSKLSRSSQLNIDLSSSAAIW